MTATHTAHALQLNKTAIFFVAGAVGGCCNVLLTWTLLQLLGVGGYQTIGLTLSAAFFATAAAFEWLRIYALRHSADTGSFGAVYLLYGVSAATLLLFGVAGALAFPAGMAGVGVLMVALIAIVQAVGDFLIVIGRAARSSGMVMLVQAGRGAVSLVVCAIAAATQGPVAALIAYAASHLVVSLAALLLFGRRMPAPRPLSFAPAAGIVRFGAPLMLSALVNALMLMSDRWVLALSGDPAADAALGAYVGISDIYIRGLSFFANVLVAAFFQEIAASLDRNAAETAKIQCRLMSGLFFYAVTPICVGSVLFYDTIGDLLFPAGDERPSVLLFVVILAATITYIARNALIESLLIMAKKTMAVLLLSIVCFACAFALALMLLPVWGVIAVPACFCAASLAAAVGGWVLLPGHMRSLLAYRDALWALCAAALAAAMALVLAKALPGAPVSASIACFVCIYAAAAFWLGRAHIRRLVAGRSA